MTTKHNGLVEYQPIIDITLIGSDKSTNEDIFTLEKSMQDMETITLDKTRIIGGGMLAQQIFIPKGTVLTGCIHKKEHLNIIVSGDITVATEDGNVRIDASHAPKTIVSKAGTKRAGIAHSDTIWITIHTYDESMTEEDIVTNKPEFLLEFNKE